jgi:hypothetical protein
MVTLLEKINLNNKPEVASHPARGISPLRAVAPRRVGSPTALTLLYTSCGNFPKLMKKFFENLRYFGIDSRHNPVAARPYGQPSIFCARES